MHKLFLAVYKNFVEVIGLQTVNVGLGFFLMLACVICLLLNMFHYSH